MKLKLFLLPLLALLTMTAGAQLTPGRVNSKVVLQSAKKLVYTSNLASEFTARTLVDKAYADSGRYKSYSVLISQASSAAPTVTVLENHMGTIVWARSSAGVYTGTLTGAFVSGKTWFVAQNNSGAGVVYTIVRTSANVLTVTTTTGGTPTDGLLSATPLEVRVYN